jgi:hypothetical protein
VAEQRLGLYRALGVEENPALRPLADRYLELCFIGNYTGIGLMNEGPLTGKGRQRALLTAHLRVIEATMRLATQLGIRAVPPEQRSKGTGSLPPLSDEDYEAIEQVLARARGRDVEAVEPAPTEQPAHFRIRIPTEGAES